MDLSSQVAAVVKPIPFKGIEEFFDISGLLVDPGLFKKVIDSLCERVASYNADYICALDARGFLIGTPVSLQLNIPLVMLRKRGKLPGECFHTVFDKEYESGDVLEVQCGAIKRGSTVVIVDDVLATGGSMKAAYSLVTQFQPKRVIGACLMNLGLPMSVTLHDEGLEVFSLFDVREWKSQATF